MQWKKGKAKTGGRRPGVANRSTVTYRAALAATYRGVGGDAAFMEWARENRTEFYRIMARLLPVEREVQSRGNVAIIVRRYTPEGTRTRVQPVHVPVPPAPSEEHDGE